MEQNISSGNSKWSLAAKDGLILAAVTVVVSTLTFLTKNTILASLLWVVKLGGSIWVLSVIMKKYREAHPDESNFGYGVIVCVLSALICAIWAFFEYQVLFPDAVAEIFEQSMTSMEQMGGMLGELPEGFTDMMLRLEDNYAQINCITTFFWCSLLGLVLSAIISRTGSGRPGSNPFTEEEMKQNNDEFNF